ncbi:MAG: BatA and WFA domain-containing protein [Bacillota bacterium]
MHFFSPQTLWLALTVPAILALYILRPRHKQKTVPSTLLWRQAVAPQEATRPWQRLKTQPLLWLQLLAAALLTLGAAAPVWYLKEPSPSTIVLLDASASMQAVDGQETRFSRAVSEVEALARGLEKGARLTVIAFDRQPRVIVKDSNDYAEIKRALAELKPSPFSADLRPALSLAGALAGEQNQPRLLVFSDGGLTWPAAEEKNGLELRLVGSRQAANVAIASLNLRPAGTGQAALAMLVNRGAVPASGKVHLSAGDRPREAKTFQLKPGEAVSFLWSDLPGGVPVAAELQVDDPGMDHFPLDNQAWAVPQEKQKRKVLLVTDGNIFLEKVFNIFPCLDVYKVTCERYPDLLTGSFGYDLTVLDGVAKPLPPAGAVLLLNPPAGENIRGLTAGEEFKPGELVPEAGSPLVEYVDLSQVHVARANSLELKSNWHKDVTADGKVILAHGAAPEGRTAVLGFGLGASDLALRPAFPVLMQNVLSWLLPPDLDVAGQAALGEEIKINAWARAQKITVENPDGSVLSLAPPFPPAPWVPEKPGLYRLTQYVQADGQRISRVSRLVAVNGYNERESDIVLKDLSSAEKGGVTQSVPEPRPLPLAGGLTLLALVVVLVEWGVASRGH